MEPLQYFLRIRMMKRPGIDLKRRCALCQSENSIPCFSRIFLYTYAISCIWHLLALTIATQIDLREKQNTIKTAYICLFVCLFVFFVFFGGGRLGHLDFWLYLCPQWVVVDADIMLPSFRT